MMFFILILFMTLLGSFAGLFLKIASDSSRGLQIIRKGSLYAGAVLYITAAVLNIYLLSKYEYSQVYPATSLTYVWTMIISFFVLKEIPGVRKTLGVLLVVVGVAVMAP